MRNVQVLPNGVMNSERDKSQAPGSLSMRAVRWLRSPWMPVVIVLACYAWWTLGAVHNGHDI
ncbi:MAG: hypothetical protein ACXWPI_19450, partial [Ktedonobacterales bacterium]